MIGITTQFAKSENDPGTSKFFGAPTMPEEWLTDGTVADDEFYFAQMRLAEIAPYDTEHLLPETGFLYFFLAETDGGFRANVRYFDGEPETLVDDFNEGFDLGDDTLADCSASFEETEDAPDGTALLRRDGGEIVLLQYDPLDESKPEYLADTEQVLTFRIAPDDLRAKAFDRVTVTLEDVL